MIQIRLHTFETNSSSTHSLVMCSDDEYKAWENGELYLCVYDWFCKDIKEKYQIPDYEEGKFYSVEEINKLFDKLHVDFANDGDYHYSRAEFFRTFKEYLYDEYDDEDYENNYESCLETYDETYTTKSGEIVHAFGKYGNDY